MPIEENTFRCSGCRKVLAEVALNDGKLKIKCKCGTMNTLEATPKKEPKNYIHNQPYQNRMDLVKKH